MTPANDNVKTDFCLARVSHAMEAETLQQERLNAELSEYENAFLEMGAPRSKRVWVEDIYGGRWE